ncbi:MAG: D-erythronate dehydrogenase [Pseudomonadota bacterium]
MTQAKRANTRVMILGGAGMIGQKLLKHLAQHGLSGYDVTALSLYDVVDAAHADDCPFEVDTRTGALHEPGEAEWIAAQRPDVIFHLAAIVSGDAERNFDRGWEINARSSWALLDALRAEHTASGGAYCPRLVFSSSIAVFGAPFPDKIGDDFHATPLTSYGAQKAMTELQVADYSRKGFLDGVSIRLPTVTVRPGQANLAASSFFSSIIREPLNGERAVLPVDDSVRHWHASPRSAAGFLAHAASLTRAQLDGRPTLNMPGYSCTVAEQIDALRSIAGNDVVARIEYKRDPEVAAIVKNWPRDFDVQRAPALGFQSEANYEDIIRVYIEDDLPHHTTR